MNKNFNRKALPLIKVSFAARLARPWISGIGESMWVLKLTGTKMRGAGLLANEPYQLRYVRLGDLVLYATDRSHEKPEALVVVQPKLEQNFKAMYNGNQEAWAVAASTSRDECKALLKQLNSARCRRAMARIEKFRQRIRGCAICGARDRWWMTTNEKWALVPKRFRHKVLPPMLCGVRHRKKTVIEVKAGEAEPRNCTTAMSPRQSLRTFIYSLVVHSGLRDWRSAH